MLDFCKPIVNAELRSDGIIMYDTDGTTSSLHSGYCYGAFAAIYTISFLYDEDNYPGVGHSVTYICPHKGTDSGVGVMQMIRIFDHYARQHPEELDRQFNVTALKAFRKAFPCPGAR